MSIQFTCDDKQTLIAYLYGEIEPPSATGRSASRGGGACADEAAAARRRARAGLWMTPHAELTCHRQEVELPPSNVLRPARWWNAVPVWAQAAAALCSCRGARAIASVQVKSVPMVSQ